ncbi:MAG TPA: polysialyltransferase family glycosyltransferase [Burkholderiaceae bacterium]|nr:polysialyltransferase family glycosyltransferase [Burkholderiaceae bacterium]
MSMSGSKVAVYFVASPLQYLAARRIAENFEDDARQVLVWYKPGLKAVVEETQWDACSYMPWPRLEPLPGAFGRHRRLRANIRLVAQLVGRCDTLVLHSAVFDTEAINYFLHALPAACGAREVHARILPDGLISIRRYPLNAPKRMLQHLRKLRQLFAPELRYQYFSGDRIGSDAPFCDRIYVLPDLPCEYPPEKVCVLPPLVDTARQASDGASSGEGRALVIGQPLTGFGLLSPQDLAAVTLEIRAWLERQGIRNIDYKAHPKDQIHELSHPDYRLIDPPGALESYMAATHYDAVVGVRSSALLFARNIYPGSVRVLAFGWNRVRFKSQEEKEDMRKAFSACGVELASE